MGSGGTPGDERSRVLCWMAQSEVFAVPPLKHFLLFVSLPFLRNDIGNLRLLRVSSQSCLAYYSGMLFGDVDANTQRVKRMLPLEIVVLRSESFFQKVGHGGRTRYHGGRIH